MSKKIKQLGSRTRAAALKNCALYVAQRAEAEHGVTNYEIDKALMLRLPLQSAFDWANNPQGLRYWLRKAVPAEYKHTLKNSELVARFKDRKKVYNRSGNHAIHVKGVKDTTKLALFLQRRGFELMGNLKVGVLGGKPKTIIVYGDAKRASAYKYRPESYIFSKLHKSVNQFIKQFR